MKIVAGPEVAMIRAYDELVKFIMLHVTNSYIFYSTVGSDSLNDRSQELLKAVDKFGIRIRALPNNQKHSLVQRNGAKEQLLTQADANWWARGGPIIRWNYDEDAIPPFSKSMILGHEIAHILFRHEGGKTKIEFEAEATSYLVHAMLGERKLFRSSSYIGSKFRGPSRIPIIASSSRDDIFKNANKILEAIR